MTMLRIGHHHLQLLDYYVLDQLDAICKTFHIVKRKIETSSTRMIPSRNAYVCINLASTF
jgi:hypothetical protein